jgi:peptidoglycan biosynthesis protein MviN/MurJ (putative lipid II flippase)
VTINAIILFVPLRKSGLVTITTIYRSLKLVLATAVCSGAALATLAFMPNSGVLLRTVLPALIGAAAYFGISFLLKAIPRPEL